MSEKTTEEFNNLTSLPLAENSSIQEKSNINHNNNTM